MTTIERHETEFILFGTKPTVSMDDIKAAAKKAEHFRLRYSDYCEKHNLQALNTTARTYRSNWRRAMTELYDLIYWYEDINNTKISHTHFDYL